MAAALAVHPFVASRFALRELNPGWLGGRLEHPQETGLNPYTYPAYLPHAGGSGLGVWRERHQAIGGFDASLPALEDTDYCWRLQLAGTPLVFVPEAVVHVRLPGTLAGHFRQMLAYGESNVCLYRRYRDRGMPRLGMLPGALRWAKLLLGLPRVASRRGRVEWISQLGWRLGRLRGCWRYRVLAP
jgi:cellulose synthase/poly-beta-1,6-N-acetylglucosamine synthase-like glycosyltransferase